MDGTAVGTLRCDVRGQLGDPCPPGVISRVGYDVHNNKDAARVFYLFFTLTMQPLAASKSKLLCKSGVQLV